MSKFFNKNTRKIAGCVLAGIQFILSVIFIWIAASTKVVPMKYLLLAGILLGVLSVLEVLMQIKKVSGIVGIALAAVLCVALGIGIHFVRKADSALDKVTGSRTEITVINVYVKQDDPAQSINDAVNNGYVFGVLKVGEREKVDEAISEIENDLSTTLQIKEYDSIFQIAADLESGDLKAFIANSGFVTILDGSEEYYNYSEKLRILMEKKIETVVEIDDEGDPEKGTNDEKAPECFVAYISGIDTFGSVSVKSRSDVNILAIVNRSSRQVLLLSTPRDYYVPLSVSGGEKDKLTHAGIYGIECSIDTLEMLYEVDINYYVRMNFTGFEKIIDALGGVDVESQYDFSTSMGANTFNYHQGINHLSGEAALAFSRERYSFRDGDFQRGRNQMAVIKAVISALESSKLLTNFSEVMDGLAESFETNMSKNALGELVQEQLDTDKSWTILTYSATGVGAMRGTFSAGGAERSVVLANEDSVAYANELIKRIQGGEIMTQDQITSNAP